jgi:transcriptional regulator with XRE-family HTH domain
MSTETVTGLSRTRGGNRGPLLPYEQARRASAWLRETRNSPGLSDAVIGRLLGMSPAWTSARATGSTRMTQAEVTEIAAALGVPVPDLTAEGGAR